MEKFTLYDKSILDELYEDPPDLESLTLDDLLQLPLNEEYIEYNKDKEPPNYKGFGDEYVKAKPISLNELPTYYEKECKAQIQPTMKRIEIGNDCNDIKENLTVTFDENKYLNPDICKD